MFSLLSSPVELIKTGYLYRRTDVAASWACIVAFDTLALVLTLHRTLAVHRVLRMRHGLFWLMMRDGKFVAPRSFSDANSSVGIVYFGSVTSPCVPLWLLHRSYTDRILVMLYLVNIATLLVSDCSALYSLYARHTDSWYPF